MSLAWASCWSGRQAGWQLGRLRGMSCEPCFGGGRRKAVLPSGEAAALYAELNADIAAADIVIQPETADMEREFGVVLDKCFSQTPLTFIRTNDALHLASAKVAGEPEFITGDVRQRAAALLDKENCIQLPLPFWRASESGIGRCLFVQRRLCNDQTTGAERRQESNGWSSGRVTKRAKMLALRHHHTAMRELELRYRTLFPLSSNLPLGHGCGPAARTRSPRWKRLPSSWANGRLSPPRGCWRPSGRSA
jgi:hypothetical protein